MGSVENRQLRMNRLDIEENLLLERGKRRSLYYCHAYLLLLSQRRFLPFGSPIPSRRKSFDNPSTFGAGKVRCPIQCFHGSFAI